MMIRRTERSGIGEARWPFFLTLLLAVVVVAVPPIFGHAASLFTFYNALQSTACLGLIALGLGLTMIVGEFDLSVASTYALGGMLAVKFGGGSPIVGLLIGVGACVIFGLVFKGSSSLAGESTRWRSPWADPLLRWESLELSATTRASPMRTTT